MNNIITDLEQLKKQLPPVYQQRLEQELKVICENNSGNLMSYFLVLADVFEFARKNNIYTPVLRGSSGGSLVNYLLGITKIDPIQWNLPFSRFLSYARIVRGSLPDIDSDWPSAKRDIINKYIFDKYGDRAAHVATFTMLKLKNSLLDCFRVKVIQPTEAEIRNLKIKGFAQQAQILRGELDHKIKRFNDVRKSLGNAPVGIDDIEWLEGYEIEETLYPGLLEANQTFREWCEEYPEVLENTKKIIGLPRNIGVHAGGVVISPVPLHEIVPVMKMDGLNVVGYNKKVVQKLGLIKYDNLGLKTLDYISDCLDLLKNKGIEVDIDNLPDDPDVYRVYRDGRCLSIFQCSTPGAGPFMQKLNPKCINDIIVSVALNRPGALDAEVEFSDGSKMVAAYAYIERKNGNLPVEYIHPDLEPYLKDTYGIMVYQESVQAVLQGLLGFTEEEADEIRGHISDKNPSAFKIVKERLPRLLERGWTQEQAQSLYETILAFSSYAFNKSHSVGYGLTSYQTAYLKAKYPLEWWCSVLSHAKPDDITDKYWIDVQNFVSHPSVNESSEKFSIKNDKLTPPLKLIDGVGEAANFEIASHGPYQTLEDFLSKTNARVINKKVLLALLKAGALNCFFDSQMTWVDKVEKIFQNRKKKEPVPDEFKNLTPYKEYLLVKSALNIAPIKLSEVIEKTDNLSKPIVVESRIINGQEILIKTVRGKIPLLTGERFAALHSKIDFLFEPKTVSAYVYLKSLRRFTYQNKTKTAMEMFLDLDGFSLQVVAWPQWNESEPSFINLIDEGKCYLMTFQLKANDRFPVKILNIESILEKI